MTDDFDRSPKVISVPISKIVKSSYEKDSLFLEKYTSLIEGKANGLYTRVSLGSIYPYFIKNDGGKLVKVHPNIDQHTIKMIAESIRGGGRPLVHLYQTAFKGIETKLVCTDDVNIYYAYKSLGISQLPSLIIDGKLSKRVHAAIQVKQIDKVACVLKILPAEEEDNKLVCNKDDVDLQSTIDKLVSLQDKLANFDNKKESTSYHNCLKHYLDTSYKQVGAIAHLVAGGYIYEAIPLLRTYYEHCLSMYIDWLSPQFIGTYLDLTSQATPKEWDKAIQEIAYQKNNKSTNTYLVKKMKFLYAFLNKVHDKASINPLSSHHRRFYKFVSEYSHQKFIITKSNILGLSEYSLDQALILIVRYVCAITEQIINTIGTDIGEEEKSAFTVVQ